MKGKFQHLTRQNFQNTSLYFETSCRLRDIYQRLPNLQPEDEHNISPETNFFMFKTTRLRRNKFRGIFTSRNLGTTYQETSLAVED